MTKAWALALLFSACGSRSGLLTLDPLERPDAGTPMTMEDGGGADAGWDAGAFDAGEAEPPPPGVEPAIQVSAGLFHTCAATRVGRVHCWGFNNLGQVGDGTTETRREPVAHPGVHDARAITTGREHSCAIRGDGTVSCWGSNITRQLGDGTSEFRQLAPVRVVGLTNVIEIAAGGEHTCARVRGDQLYCFGRSFEPTPELVPFDDAVLEVAGGYRHTCARLSSGRVSCWGSASLAGMTYPHDHEYSFVRGLPPVAEITSGDVHSCAAEASGAVWCWDFELYDEVRFVMGERVVESHVRPSVATRVPIDDAVQLTAGHEFTCALRAGGRVTCWGNNERGQLGDGGLDQTIGAFVDPIGLHDVMWISAGWRHACALETNGVVMCWGRNTEGELGDGSTAEHQPPIMAAVLAD